MSNPANRLKFARRAAAVGAAILLTAAVSGFFMGLQSNTSKISLSRAQQIITPDSARRASAAAAGVRPALAYRELDRRRTGPNANWINSTATLPALGNVPTKEATEAERAAARDLRASRRAFDGAPPVVPHPIQQDTPAGCLACHGAGFAMRERVASKISHPPFSQCTQCHVPAGGPGFSTTTPAVAANSFAGLRSVAAVRAFDGAPPVVPHGIALRTDCLSCHGPGGAHGLRTPHPERQSCLQCHTVPAELDLLRGQAPASTRRTP